MTFTKISARAEGPTLSKDRKTKSRFTPELPKPMTPYDRMSEAARTITEGETRLRAEKTARLRAIRLGQEDPDESQGE